MKEGKHYRRRKPMVGFAQTGTPSLEGAAPSRYRHHQRRLLSRPNSHMRNSSEEPSANKKPGNKYPLSWKLQLLTGLCVCLANGSLLLYFGWMYSSKGMKLLHILLFKDSEMIDMPAQNHYHKVEKIWRYQRKQVGNSTTDIAVDDNGSIHPPPIVVVGLPKAGTSSLFEFFACHGIYSQHWYCCGPQHHADQPGSGGPRFGPSYMSHCLLENLQEQEQKKQENQDASTKHSILDGCGDYDVYTELNGPYLPPSSTPQQERNHPDTSSPFHSTKGIFLPQHYHLEDMHEAAPTATWILNARPVDDWIRSVRNVPARSLVERLHYEVLVKHALENEKTGKYQEYSMLVGSTSHIRKGHNSSLRSIPRWQQEELFLRDFYHAHIQRVQDFVKDHEHRLILVNISDPNAGVQLGKDLGWWGTEEVNVAKPRRASPSKAQACWKRYNAGEYDPS